jgi:hypothetical protein
MVVDTVRKAPTLCISFIYGPYYIIYIPLLNIAEEGIKTR